MYLDDFIEENYEILTAAGRAAYDYMMEEFTEDDYCADIVDYTAEYFTDKEELLEKVRFYLGHAEARRRVADAGYEIVVGHRHEIKDRVRTVLSCYFALSGEGVMDRKKEFEGEF